MDTLLEFLRMDGFAVWVWSAFGLTAAVLSIGAVIIHRRHDRALAHIRKLSQGGRS